MMSCKGNLALRLHGLWRACVNASEVTSVVSDSLWPHGPQPTRLLCPWDSPGKNTGVGCHFLLQGVFLTQGWNPCLLHCWQILEHGSQGSAWWPVVCKWSQLPKRAYSHPQTSSHEISPCLSSFIICYRIRVATKSQTTNKKVSFIKHTTVLIEKPCTLHTHHGHTYVSHSRTFTSTVNIYPENPTLVRLKRETESKRGNI